MLVKVKGKGVKLNGIWKYKNEEAEISETEWEENKEYVDIIKDDEGEKLPQVPDKNDQDPEETELIELRKKAKKLGIRNYYAMKKETLERYIAEKEAPLFGAETDEKTDDSDEHSDESNSDNNEKDVSGKDNPQE